MSLLSGTWRLVYSSAFASGSLGGFRPGPQAALVPVTIGQVRFCSCSSQPRPCYMWYSYESLKHA